MPTLRAPTKQKPLNAFRKATVSADPNEPPPEGPPMLIAELLDRYLVSIVPKLAERTQKDYAWIIGKLREHFGHREVNSLKPKDIGQYLDVEKGKQSRNRQIAVLSAVYTKAVGRWYVADRNPCLGVERNETHKRDRYVTDEEFKAVRALLSERHQAAMDLALLTGQRQGDLLKLTWDEVLDDGVFFQQGKTGKKLLIQYTDELEAVLTRCKRMLPNIPRRFVLRRRDGKRYSSEGFKAIWIRAMNKAVESGVIATRFTFHDLRAKCVSDTKDIQAAFERAGHTSMSMTRGVYDRGTRKVTALR